MLGDPQGCARTGRSPSGRGSRAGAGSAATDQLPPWRRQPGGPGAAADPGGAALRRFDYDGPGDSDESYIAIRTRRVTCRAAKGLMLWVALANDSRPARWRCVYPVLGRATWTRGRKRISFQPAAGSSRRNSPMLIGTDFEDVAALS